MTTESGSDEIQRTGLHSFALVPPLVAHFTACDNPLTGRSGEPVYYFLSRSLTVRDAFTLHNELACCGAIMRPPYDALSPFVTPFEFFVQSLGPGEFLCSPPLT